MAQPPADPTRSHAAPPRHAAMLEPGAWVRLAARPEWGLGQVQSVAGERVTVNFEHAGKVLVNTRAAVLDPADLPGAPRTTQRP